MSIAEQINEFTRAELSTCQCYSLLVERHQFIFWNVIPFFFFTDFIL